EEQIPDMTKNVDSTIQETRDSTTRNQLP
ncbi:unnamed protein product, partial [Didymodactylos carnosus]